MFYCITVFLSWRRGGRAETTPKRRPGVVVPCAPQRRPDVIAPLAPFSRPVRGRQRLGPSGLKGRRWCELWLAGWSCPRDPSTAGEATTAAASHAAPTRHLGLCTSEPPLPRADIATSCVPSFLHKACCLCFRCGYCDILKRVRREGKQG